MNEPKSEQSGLLARIASGDGAAVRECIDQYGGLLWSLARRLALNDSEAEDAIQEVFVEIWKNARKYDPNIASETAFIAMLARRRLIDRRRRISRQPENMALSELASPESMAEGWTSSNSLSLSPGQDKVVAGEEARRAGIALDQLSVDQQRVLRLSVYRGLSHDLISKSLSMPLGTVKTHARRGLIRLREILGAPPSGSATAAARAGGDPGTEQGLNHGIDQTRRRDAETGAAATDPSSRLTISTAPAGSGSTGKQSGSGDDDVVVENPESGSTPRREGDQR